MDICRRVAVMPDERAGEGFAYLVGVVDKLRGKDGCPWDKEQTEQDVKAFLLEEVYELISAIEQQDVDEIKEEIGDVLLLCVFLAKIYAEKGLFSINDSLCEVLDKLIRRHPHVFGDLKLSNSHEVIKNWTRIKEKEKAAKKKINKSNLWNSVPKAAPSLFQYYTYLKEHQKHGRLLNIRPDEKLHLLKESFQNEKVDKKCVQDLLMFICELAYLNGIDPELVFLERIDEMRKADSA